MEIAFSIYRLINIQKERGLMMDHLRFRQSYALSVGCNCYVYFKRLPFIVTKDKYNANLQC